MATSAFTTSVPVNSVEKDPDKKQEPLQVLVAENSVIVDAPSVDKSEIEEFDKSIDIIKKYKTLKSLYSKIESNLDKLKEIHEAWESSTDLEMSLKKDKRNLTILLKFADKDDVNSMQKSFDNVWLFNFILKDKDLYKSICELTEERKKGLKKEIGNYVKSIEEAENKAKKYLDGYKNLKAYISGDALNVNISKSEQGDPIKISDIFKLEKEINQLNICCDYKEELCAYKRENKRYYEFKAGSYEMTMSWPVKDEDGNYFDCTAVMDMGANGITKIETVEIDGKQLYEPQEIVNWAKQNKELYIQRLPLSEALRNFFGLSHGETLRSNNCGSSESIKINNSDSLPKKVTEEENSWVEKEKQRSEVKEVKRKEKQFCILA